MIPLLCVAILACWIAGQTRVAAETRGNRSDTLSPAEDENTYRVQVGAFLSKDRAKRLKRKIEADPRFDGLKVVLEFSARSGVYKTKVGEFPAEEMAETVKGLFLEAGYEESTVVADQFPAGRRTREGSLERPPGS